MGLRSQVLIDASESLVAEGTVFQGSRGAVGATGWHARVRTCRGGRSEGVHVIELDNEHMCIDVLPTRGMGIWRVRRGEKTLGWEAPSREPVHPAFVPLFEPSGLGWLDGFNELLCRCGLESNGPPEFDSTGRLVRPLHGRIANLPAQRVELIIDEDAGRLTLRGIVEESRFHFQSLRLTASITTTLGSNEFAWTDEVENIGGRDATLQMLYHFNVGHPLLQPGARISAPVATVAPLTDVAAREGVETWNIMPPARPGSAEQVYCLDLLADDAGDTRLLVSGLADNEAISLRFNKPALPCFTVWRNTPAEIDGYVLGIEPGTNYPNPHSFEKRQGRVATLKPGEIWRGKVTAAWLTDAGKIADEDKSIRAMQMDRHANIAPKPRDDWSASA
jgi:galactose mutarotase-like enzyme